MSNPYEMFSTNTDLESGAGVRFEYGGDDGFAVLIHRAGGANKKFSKVFAEKIRPHRRAHKNGTLSEEIAERIMIETYAETVVVGWENVRNEKGEILEFTTENVVELFTRIPEFYAEIVEQAQDLRNFRIEQEDLEIKN